MVYQYVGQLKSIPVLDQTMVLPLAFVQINVLPLTAHYYIVANRWVNKYHTTQYNHMVVQTGY